MIMPLGSGAGDGLVVGGEGAGGDDEGVGGCGAEVGAGGDDEGVGGCGAEVGEGERLVDGGDE